MPFLQDLRRSASADWGPVILSQSRTLWLYVLTAVFHQAGWGLFKPFFHPSLLPSLPEYQSLWALNSMQLLQENPTCNKALLLSKVAQGFHVTESRCQLWLRKKNRITLINFCFSVCAIYVKVFQVWWFIHIHHICTEYHVLRASCQGPYGLCNDSSLELMPISLAVAPGEVALSLEALGKQLLVVTWIPGLWWHLGRVGAEMLNSYNDPEGPSW